MTAGRIPEHVPDGVDALFEEHLYEGGDARLFYLFAGLEVRECPSSSNLPFSCYVLANASPSLPSVTRD